MAEEILAPVKIEILIRPASDAEGPSIAEKSDAPLSLEKFELDKLKFHWDVWKSESKAFWGRATLGSVALLLSILFQFHIATMDIPIPGVKFALPTNPWPVYVFINVLSWLMWWFLIFKFVDLLRHRVPEDESRPFESLIHNNRLPFWPKPINLKFFGRLLYVFFIAYAVVLAFPLSFASYSLYKFRPPGDEIWSFLVRDISPEEKSPPNKEDSLNVKPMDPTPPSADTTPPIRKQEGKQPNRSTQPRK